MNIVVGRRPHSHKWLRYYLQDLRKTHFERRILELLDEILVE